MQLNLRAVARIVAAAVIGVLGLTATGRAATTNSEWFHDAWRASLASTPLPGKGCFKASYPVVLWQQIPCAAAPNPAPAHGNRAWTPNVGGGADYSAQSATIISAAEGIFPSVKGLRSEQGPDGPNEYSLQLNSDFMSHTPNCAGALDPTKCYGWAQFVYDSYYQNAYIQYWLVDYFNTCPTGWNFSGGSCWQNSSLVPVPLLKIKKLPLMKVYGSAGFNGPDTLIFYLGTTAYSTTGDDTLVDLAEHWQASEFNVFGNGGSDQAQFNPGTKLQVAIALSNGTTDAPKCKKNSGTSGETNNLNLGRCHAFGGSPPYVQFGESLKK